MDICRLKVEAEVNGKNLNNERFLLDVLAGLTSEPKKLSSKYFYDAKGDRIFQRIMNLPEYYLTRSELEILKYQSADIVKAVKTYVKEFDVVELGAGDASKSVYLLEELVQSREQFTYFPIDISADIIGQLEKELPVKLPGLNVSGLNGEYFDMIKKARQLSEKPKLYLFMGANIGNFQMNDLIAFAQQLRALLSEEDLLLVGFDLKKNPHQVLAAYNDSAGATKEFNLNLLTRINRELEGNFKLENFEHYASYDPITGVCKSYLVSLREQIVRIGEESVYFNEHEVIHMETSLKFSSGEINKLAHQSGFKPVTQFYDTRKWFVDSLWKPY